MKFKGVILDIDGTFVDSNDQHALAWVEALQQEGYDVPYEKIRRLIGMGGDNLLPAAVGLSEDTKVGKKISENRGKIFKKKYLDGLKPFPKGRELCQEMKRRGLRLTVASSASKEDLKALLRIAKIDDLIESKTSGDDAENSKPDPDIVKEALSRLEMSGDEAVMLGDTPYDIKAAKKVGVKTIAFTCGGWLRDELKDAMAIYRDPEELLNDKANPLLA